MDSKFPQQCDLRTSKSSHWTLITGNYILSARVHYALLVYSRLLLPVAIWTVGEICKPYTTRPSADTRGSDFLASRALMAANIASASGHPSPTRLPASRTSYEWISRYYSDLKARWDQRSKNNDYIYTSSLIGFSDQFMVFINSLCQSTFTWTA